MEAYEAFAQVYDLFMDDVDYDGWCRVIAKRLASYGISDGLVCELGCGTGEMTERLAKAGYDMIGIDRSVEMLQIAQEKKFASGADILYLCQEMQSFELYGTVRAVVSVCNSLNYILEDAELLEVFRLVNNYLDPGGIFLFDLNMDAYYRQIGDGTIAENRDAAAFIWENHYDEKTHLNEYDLHLFLADRAEGDERASGGGEPCCFRRYDECHLQRAWTREEIGELVEASGMAYLGACEAYTENEAREGTARILFAAREQGKQPV